MLSLLDLFSLYNAEDDHFLPRTLEVYANWVNLVMLQRILLTKYIVHTSKEIKDSLSFN